MDGLGNPMNPYGKFPSLRSEFSTLTGIFKWPIVRWLIGMRRAIGGRKHVKQERFVTTGTSEIEVRSVDWVNGACMMLRRGVAHLDEGYFFYGEDIDLCMRVRRNGGDVGFLPSVSIVHYGGGSSGRDYLVLLRQVHVFPDAVL